ncbi:hypothetical protein IE077_003641 [Cardiosporidium cionae]|uniref:RAP domain-containing protein n=1 Tax=Cardiosporidium cionae TaxID=476202 RepID=A0ABQ7J7Y3_9APIC|nr:hypothetical protein IE077_003641 [Cardiosporidium cionae]|eukprot:KAF8820049.1 hypothetical protein IE077_003641 [Cardiosporidium cionae]
MSISSVHFTFWRMYRLHSLHRFNLARNASCAFYCRQRIANLNTVDSSTRLSTVLPVVSKSSYPCNSFSQRSSYYHSPLQEYSFSTGASHSHEDDVRSLKTGDEVLSYFCSRNVPGSFPLQQLLRFLQAILRLPAVNVSKEPNPAEKNSHSNDAVSPGELAIATSSKEKSRNPKSASESLHVRGNKSIETGYSKGKHIIWKDERFSKLIDEMSELVDSAENRILSILCLNLASVRYPVESVQLLSKKLAGIMLQKENMLTAKQLCGFALGFSTMPYRDRHVSDFIRFEALKILDTFLPGDLYALLESMRRWSLFNRELTDTVIEKMLDIIDQYNAEDVTNTLNLLANASLVRGVLIRRLSSLAMDNLNAFQPRQLVITFQALSRLRFISSENVALLCNAIMSSIDTLSNEDVARVLASICLSPPFDNESIVRTLLKRFSNKPPTNIHTLSKVLYVICFYEFYDMSDYLKQGLEICFQLPSSEHREILARLVEVVHTVEIELPEYAMAVPPAWRAAMEEFEHAQMTRSETSRMLKELLLVLDSLPLKTKLHFQTNQQAGPYRVDLLDANSKICLSIDWISRVTLPDLQHRNLSKLGYQAIPISFWLWRRLRTEDEQRKFLLKNLEKIHIY